MAHYFLKIDENDSRPGASIRVETRGEVAFLKVKKCIVIDNIYIYISVA